MFLSSGTKKEKILLFSSEVINEIFKASLVTYLFFYLIENFIVGYINDYFNLNILLIITIASGILTILYKKEGSIKKEKQKIRTRDYIFIMILGLIATGIIYFKAQQTGWLSYVISVISGIIIILLSILLLNESEEDDRRSKD